MTAKTITVEQFTKDMWEAQCKDIRHSLGSAVPADELDARFPTWDRLDQTAREVRIKQVTEDLLQPLYMAGYEIRRRIKPVDPQHN